MTMPRTVNCIKLGREAEGLEHQKMLVNEPQQPMNNVSGQSL